MAMSTGTSLRDDDEKDVGLSKIHHDVYTSTEEVRPVDQVVLQRALRKVDYRLLPPLAILYLFSYLDRGSVANASIFGYKESLGINATQYNLITTVFFFTYGGFEIPGAILMSKFEPRLWITGICFAWGLVMTLSGLVQNFGGAIAARLALGLAEASFFPSAITLVGNWYPRGQLQTRISAFYVVGVFSGAFSGLLAYGINYMDGAGGLESWRWIFILEGIATVVLSGLIWFFLPNDPDSVKFLTDEERNAIKANRAAEGDGGHAHFEWKYLKQVVTDPKVLLATFMASSVNIVTFGFSYQLPAIIVQLGYTAANAQLMTVPVYFCACLCTFLGAIYSDRMGRRFHMIFVGFGVALAGLVMLYCLPKDRIPGVRYFACIVLMTGIYVSFPGILTTNSNNAETRGKRNISVAALLTVASLATAAGTNSYLARQAPRYQIGFGFSMAMSAASMCACLILVWLCKRDNAKLDIIEREQIGDAVTEEEIARLKFRYMY